MRTKTILLAFTLLFASFAYAEKNPVKVTLNDGTTFDWNNYSDTVDSYCTYKHSGQFCIPKKDVESIVEIKDDISKDAHVIYSCTKNCGQSFKPVNRPRQDEAIWDRQKPDNREQAQQPQQEKQPQGGLKRCGSNNDCGPHMICDRQYIYSTRGSGYAKICVQANKWNDKDWWAR